MSEVAVAEPTKRRHSAVMAEAWIRCDQFNAENPIGTKVVMGDPETSKLRATQSEAWVLALGQPVVMVTGMVGGVPLDQVTVVK